MTQRNIWKKERGYGEKGIKESEKPTVLEYNELIEGTRGRCSPPHSQEEVKARVWKVGDNLNKKQQILKADLILL